MDRLINGMDNSGMEWIRMDWNGMDEYIIVLFRFTLKEMENAWCILSGIITCTLLFE